MGKMAVYGSETRSLLLKRFALGTKNYWFAFIADSSSALFFLIWELMARPSHPLLVGLSVIMGYMTWTLTEYVFHRWVYHQEEGIFSEGHNIHHTKAEVLIAMPWAMTTVTVFGLWQLLSQVLNVAYFSGVLSGWLAGFFFYSVVHHSHHHWNVSNSWFRKLKAYHRIHHHFPDYNFGVTMRFWDIAFGTRYRKAANAPMQTQALFVSESEYGNAEISANSREDRQLVLKS
jgi:sterol desaturase/sphingolipid hydroxylase (fatty acid hydroxylase superfamily)